MMYRIEPGLKAITLHRPWAYAVAHLGKSVENRTWPCSLSVGSLIAIHAGRKFDKDAVDWIKQNTDLECPPEEAQPTGIVALARFMGNVSALDSPWFVGPIAWKLTDVLPIDPIPCPGQQRLWDVPLELLSLVQSRIETQDELQK
jgi:hypothetical protein